VAALGVAIMHIGLQATYWGHVELPWTQRGAAGVDLFFVISGFIMVYVSWDAFGSAGASAEFLRRRLIRILPLYWLVTAIVVLFGHYGLSHVLASFLFVPTGDVPIIAVGWTLNFEMMFYATFAAALLLPRRYGLAAVAFAIAALALSAILLPSSSQAAFNNSIVLEFVFGIAIGIAYFAGVRLNIAWRLAIVALGLWLFVHETGSYRFLYWGVPSALFVVAAVLGAPIRAGRIVLALAAVGEASYALYLVHWFIERMFAALLRGLNADFAVLWPLFMLLGVGVSVGAALLLHRYVELPMIGGLKRGFARSAPAGA
jgi:peptidoglycan/LPS O-acetylase OafA/YrhL